MTSAATGWADEPAFPEDAIEVGRVIGPWGLNGWLRVKPFSSDPKALFSSRRWHLRPAEGQGAPLRVPGAPALPKVLRITQSRQQGDAVVAAAQEVPDRTAAEAMKGARIFIARSSFPTAAEGEYYWVDLIGLAVVNRQGEALGTVLDLLDTGPHSVLRLRRAEAVQAADAAKGAAGDQSERLIPFVAAYVDDVNLVERRITVDWGLDY